MNSFFKLFFWSIKKTLKSHDSFPHFKMTWLNWFLCLNNISYLTKYSQLLMMMNWMNSHSWNQSMLGIFCMPLNHLSELLMMNQSTNCFTHKSPLFTAWRRMCCRYSTFCSICYRGSHHLLSLAVQQLAAKKQCLHALEREILSFPPALPVELMSPDCISASCP